MATSEYKIMYLHSFKKELDKIIYYIVNDLKNPKAAEKLLNSIEKAIIDRSSSPESYERYKSNRNRKYNWYRIYVENYTVFYTVINNTMKVVHILYSRRNFEKLV